VYNSGAYVVLIGQAMLFDLEEVESYFNNGVYSMVTMT
jgi:hypothetical protein